MSDDQADKSQTGEKEKLVLTVYQDGLQPAVREVGQTLGEIVRSALTPFNLGIVAIEEGRVKLPMRL